jgi:hypothetical protein
LAKRRLAANGDPIHRHAKARRRRDVAGHAVSNSAAY